MKQGRMTRKFDGSSGGLGRCPKNLQGASPLTRFPLPGRQEKKRGFFSYQEGDPCRSVKGQAVVFSLGRKSPPASMPP